MLEKGTLVHTKGIGASGSFKIAIRSHTIHLKLIQQRKDPPIVQEYHHILALCVCVCVFSGLSFVAPAFMRREKSGLLLLMYTVLYLNFCVLLYVHKNNVVVEPFLGRE